MWYCQQGEYYYTPVFYKLRWPRPWVSGKLGSFRDGAIPLSMDQFHGGIYYHLVSPLCNSLYRHQWIVQSQETMSWTPCPRCAQVGLHWVLGGQTSWARVQSAGRSVAWGCPNSISAGHGRLGLIGVVQRLSKILSRSCLNWMAFLCFTYHSAKPLLREYLEEFIRCMIP